MIVNMIIRIAIWFSHTYTDMKTIENTESNKNKTTMRVTVSPDHTTMQPLTRINIKLILFSPHLLNFGVVSSRIRD